jgi:hypothetical protein
MTADLEHITQWQTMRIVTAADTALTDYRPAEATAAVLAKMIDVAPATGILFQPLFLGNNNEGATLTFSGWMKSGRVGGHGGVGPGFRLLSSAFLAGNRVWGTADVPHNDGKWGAAAVWRICDTAGTPGIDTAGLVPLVDADTDGIFFLPTLGYSKILVEFTSLGASITKVGVLWRPAAYGAIVAKNHPYS